MRNVLKLNEPNMHFPCHFLRTQEDGTVTLRMPCVCYDTTLIYDY